MSLAVYQLISTIADYGNMTKAAESLHITPSAASHAISILERSLGFPLLHRNRNGVSLTRDGEFLLPQIRAVLAQEEYLQEYISQIQGMERGSVRIGVFSSICQSWIPQILHSFHMKYPPIKTYVFQGDYREIERMLLDNTIDLGVLSLPTSNQLSTSTLTHDRLLCITPPDYEPPQKTYVTLQDMKAMTLIQPQRGYDCTTQSFLENAQLTPNPHFSIMQDQAVISLVENGIGCSVIPELVLQTHTGNYNSYPIEGDPYRTIALATQQGKTQSLTTKKMMREIENCIESLSQSLPAL